MYLKGISKVSQGYLKIIQKSIYKLSPKEPQKYIKSISKSSQGYLKSIFSYLPWNNDDKVHDIPRISEVTSFVQNKTISQDFDHHFHGEDGHEHRFQLLLQKRGRVLVSKCNQPAEKRKKAIGNQ